MRHIYHRQPSMSFTCCQIASITKNKHLNFANSESKFGFEIEKKNWFEKFSYKQLVSLRRHLKTVLNKIFKLNSTAAIQIIVMHVTYVKAGVCLPFFRFQLCIVT